MKKTRDRVKELIRVKASELRANASNWRAHGDQQKAAMRGILDEVGFVSGLIAFRDKRGKLTLIDGHLRKEISGDELVPVQVVDLTEAEAKKILATFDPIGAMATSNAEALESLLAGVKTDSEGVAAMLAELMAQANAAKPTPLVHEDEVPEPPKVAITKPGDLWQLGAHRLLCGDSTKAEDVERLMGGERADLCFTSPPYNAGKSCLTNQQKKTKQSRYANSTDDRDDYAEFLRAFTDFALQRCRLIAVNIQQLANNKFAVLEWVNSYQDRFVDRAIWYKGAGCPALANSVMNSRFEDIWLFSPRDRPNRVIETAKFHGTVSNVIECGSAGGENKNADIHSATMPVKVAAYALESWSEEAALIYEPFCGCGTTMIAAEQLGRRCFAMELDPIYVDVAVARWERLTGKKAKRITAEAKPPRRGRT
jgi:DNA modification methylase